MEIFLNGLLGSKIRPLPSYSFKSFTACWPTIHPFSISFNLTHTTTLLKIQPFPISFCTPVLASPDKAPTPNAGKTVPVRNGINPANAGKNHSNFMLWFNCVFYILIVMPFFYSYAFSSLSSCELFKAITSSPCRSENVRRIAIDSQLDSNAFLSLSF